MAGRRHPVSVYDYLYIADAIAQIAVGLDVIVTLVITLIDRRRK